MEKGGTEKVQYGAGELSVVTGNEAVVVVVTWNEVVVVVVVVVVWWLWCGGRSSQN